MLIGSKENIYILGFFLNTSTVCENKYLLEWELSY